MDNVHPYYSNNAPELMSASAWRSSKVGWTSALTTLVRSRVGDSTLLETRRIRGVESGGTKSGTVDGERGNNEPGIVGGGGFRNVLSRGIGEGGLRNTA